MSATSPPLDAKHRDGLDLLRELGFAGLQHDSHVPFLAHLVGTWRLLRSWGCRPALCDAGLFHSVYGTEYFDPGVLTLPDRDTVRALIGVDAEDIVWLWCTMVRDALDPDTGETVDRRRGTPLYLSPERVADIATLWAADTVEQVARMTPDERDFARGLPRVLAMASSVAQAAVTDVRALIEAR